MFKSILSVLGGAAVGVFTISLIQYLSHQLYPAPADLNLQDTQAVGDYLKNVPAQVLLLVLFAYALGSFLGGMVAARYAPSKPVLHAVLVGVLLLVMGVANLFSMEHPVWFVVASLLVYVHMAFFGGTMSARRIP